MHPTSGPRAGVIRYLAAAVCLSYIGFGTYCFWAWKSDAPLPFLARSQFSETFSLGLVGSALLALAGAIAVYFLVFTNAKLTDYLISVEGEMRKVYWPKIRPWFSWSSELWGSTYVVIIVVVVLSVFIRVIDFVFTPLSKLIFN